jgi:SAM-dependent methyltransferase
MGGQYEAFYEKYWDGGADVPASDPTTPERKRLLLDVLARSVRPGGSVLDLGCGCGIFTAWLKEAGYDAVGADVSEKALSSARRKHEGIRFLRLNDDGALPFADSSFDAVWASEVLEHVLDVGAFLSEVRRVLKPGGLLILTTPYHGILKNVLVAVLKFDRHFDPEGPHIRFFDRKGLTRCLDRAGFAPLSWRGIGRLPGLYRTWFVVAARR